MSYLSIETIIPKQDEMMTVVEARWLQGLMGVKSGQTYLSTRQLVNS